MGRRWVAAMLKVGQQESLEWAKIVLFNSPGLGLALELGMARLVIQSPDGVTIASAEVPAEGVIDTLTRAIRVAPSATFILDGVILDTQDKQRLVPPTPPPPPPELLLQSYANALHDAFELIRNGEWELLKHVQQRTHEMANEFVRQRGLMHQCLRDVDMLDRSIVATTVTDRLSPRIAVAASGPQRINGRDILRGMQKVLTGR